MRCVVLFCGLLAFAAADTYSMEEYDDRLNLDDVLTDKDQLQAAIDCLSGEQPCKKKKHEEIRKEIAQMVEQGCANCTSETKLTLYSLLSVSKTKIPHSYNAFRNNYDPTGKLFDAFEQAIAKY